MPAVMRLATEIFGKEPFRTTNSEEAVARGCALQGAMLSPAFKVREFKVHDVSPFPIGVAWRQTAADGMAVDEGSKPPRPSSTPLSAGFLAECPYVATTVVLPRHSALPSTKLLTFKKSEPFSVDVLYTDPAADLPEGMKNTIGRADIKGFPAIKDPAAAKIKVKVKLNIHGVCSVDGANLHLEEDEPASEAAPAAEWGQPGASPPPRRPRRSPIPRSELVGIADVTREEERSPYRAAASAGSGAGSSRRRRAPRGGFFSRLFGCFGPGDGSDFDEEEEAAPAAGAAAPAPSDGAAAQEAAADQESTMQDEKSESAEAAKRKKKIRKVELDVAFQPFGGLKRHEITAAAEAEFKMQLDDRVVLETAERKNALESYVYDMRTKLGEQLAEFSVQAEREGLLARLQETEDWIYGEGDEATKGVYTQKLDELKKSGDPIELRAREAGARPKEIAALQAAIEAYVCFATSTEEKYAHIEQADKDKVMNECNTVNSWLNEMIEKQSKLAKTDNPVLLSAEMIKKREALEKLATPIMNKPKPKPKPATPSPTPATPEATPAAEEPTSPEAGAAAGDAPSEGMDVDEKPAA
eukprot:tig00000382_g24576.t1